jgi:hypothetical protein
MRHLLVWSAERVNAIACRKQSKHAVLVLKFAPWPTLAHASCSAFLTSPSAHRLRRGPALSTENRRDWCGGGACVRTPVCRRLLLRPLLWGMPCSGESMTSTSSASVSQSTTATTIIINHHHQPPAPARHSLVILPLCYDALSPTHPPTHSPTRPLTHSPTHPHSHSPTHPRTLFLLVNFARL